jgi:hypothetical protein
MCSTYVVTQSRPPRSLHGPHQSRARRVPRHPNPPRRGIETGWVLIVPALVITKPSKSICYHLAWSIPGGGTGKEEGKGTNAYRKVRRTKTSFHLPSSCANYSRCYHRSSFIGLGLYVDKVRVVRVRVAHGSDTQGGISVVRHVVRELAEQHRAELLLYLNLLAMFGEKENGGCGPCRGNRRNRHGCPVRSLDGRRTHVSVEPHRAALAWCVGSLGVGVGVGGFDGSDYVRDGDGDGDGGRRAGWLSKPRWTVDVPPTSASQQSAQSLMASRLSNAKSDRGAREGCSAPCICKTGFLMAFACCVNAGL